MAYGKGLGQVIKEIWGTQAIDFTDVSLGGYRILTHVEDTKN